MEPIALLLLAGLRMAAGVPAEPTTVVVNEIPFITPTPTLAVYGSYQPERRNIFDDFTSKVNSYVDGVFSELGTAIPSYVQDGLLPNLQGLPTGSQVMSSAGARSTDIDALPSQVLNIPGYGNMTQNGWNLRIRGNVYKQPSINNETLDDLTNAFLIDTSVQKLPPAQANQARNLTREIYVVQQGNVSVSMDIAPATDAGGDGEPGGGGGITPVGGYQTVTLPYPTTEQGDFDVFVPIQNTSGGLQSGIGEVPAQRLNLYTHGTDTGNATSYLVSQTGLTVIADIDDILRVTKIYQPKEGLLNTFARPFEPWMNMPEIFANWSQSLPNLHFHYLTTTPEQATRPYMSYIYSTYPGGSFDTRFDLPNTCSVLSANIAR